MTQDLFQRVLLPALDQLVIICGHYEGVDERVSHLLTREVSLGDFVLTCGEIPALALINGYHSPAPRHRRQKTDSLRYDSFQTPLLDYPPLHPPRHLSRLGSPRRPPLRQTHQAIADWRLEQQIERTKERRPDLYEKWMGEE